METNEQTPTSSETVVYPQKKIFLLPLLIVGTVVVSSIIAGGIGYYLGSMSKTQPIVIPPQTDQNANVSPTDQINNVACTREAKICPDGSSVGRTGPNCEFAECPTSALQDWQTVISESSNFSIKIPPTWRVTEKNEDQSILNGQDYAVNLVLSSEKGEDMGPAQFLHAITIPFAFNIKGPHFDIGKKFEQGLEGLYFQYETNSMIKNPISEYKEINGRKALVQKTESFETESELPEGFAGEYCLGCTTKTVYIDTNTGKIIEISGSWQKDSPEFEMIFDQILNTISLK